MKQMTDEQLKAWRAGLKVGDMAMVKIAKLRAEQPLEPLIAVDGGRPVYLDAWALHPLPAPDPLTDLERAVVEAAVSNFAYAKSIGITVDGFANETLIALWGACEALAAARQPPDPVKELREAWDAMKMCPLEAQWSGNEIARLERAIAALEAERGRA
jgi:hypothetical protein